MRTYILYVYCRRSGLGQDSGEHYRGDYKGEGEAVADMDERAYRLLTHYDEVEYIIKTKIGEVIRRGVHRR